MLSRKEQDKMGLPLPVSWCESAEESLTTAYHTHCEAKGFKVYGFTYPDEVFIAVSYLDLEEDSDAPVTYVVSADLMAQTDCSEKLLNTLVDSVGIFFDTYFADADWNDYNSIWSEGEYQNQEFFYKVTRENIALTIAADQLLNQ